MGSGFPQNFGQIHPTSGSSDWPNRDPHMGYSNKTGLLFKLEGSRVPFMMFNYVAHCFPSGTRSSIQHCQLRPVDLYDCPCNRTKGRMHYKYTDNVNMI